jgi:hypothetical protein
VIGQGIVDLVPYLLTFDRLIPYRLEVDNHRLSVHESSSQADDAAWRINFFESPEELFWDKFGSWAKTEMWPKITCS